MKGFMPARVSQVPIWRNKTLTDRPDPANNGDRTDKNLLKVRSPFHIMARRRDLKRGVMKVQMRSDDAGR